MRVKIPSAEDLKRLDKNKINWAEYTLFFDQTRVILVIKRFFFIVFTWMGVQKMNSNKLSMNIPGMKKRATMYCIVLYIYSNYNINNRNIVGFIPYSYNFSYNFIVTTKRLILVAGSLPTNVYFCYTIICIFVLFCSQL